MAAFNVKARVLVQQTTPEGFQGVFLENNLAAGLYLLRSHLVEHRDTPDVIERLREALEGVIENVCETFILPEQRKQLVQRYPHGSSVMLAYMGDPSCIGWAHRNSKGELLSAYSRFPLDGNSWRVLEEREIK